MREITLNEVKSISGGYSTQTAGATIIALGFAGGPFTIGFGLAIGLGLIFYGD